MTENKRSLEIYQYNAPLDSKTKSGTKAGSGKHFVSCGVEGQGPATFRIYI